MAFELVENPARSAVIKVIGIGGCGGNAVHHMVTETVQGVDFIAANTDAQALSKLESSIALQIGADVTKGLGAGANPEIGRQAAMDDRDRIEDALRGADMVFITAGMGGGTGTGAAPVVAQVAKDMDVLTVAVVTRPFSWENRGQIAAQGIADLSHHVDSLIAIPNDKLALVLDDSVSLEDAFAAADDVLLGAVQGIADIILKPGLINVDFADVSTVMRERGMAIMGTGQASGEDRAKEATEQAINSPLLDDIDIRDARGVLVNVSAGSVSLREWREVGDVVNGFKSKDATVVVGAVNAEDLGDEMRVTVVATGLGAERPSMVVSNPAADAAGPGRAERSEGHWGDLEKPTINRRMTVGERQGSVLESSGPRMLDIPEFLRRQAD